jgi:hypothetical protein
MARKRREWERLEKRLHDLSGEYSRLRARLTQIRQRCPHKEKTSVESGWKCRDCGDVSPA